MEKDDSDCIVLESQSENDKFVVYSVDENDDHDDELNHHHEAEAPQQQLTTSAWGGPAAPVCEMCKSVPSKYTCPGCDVKTCSVLCVKEHKTQLGCSGERNKTSFVDIHDYSDMHLLNDYRFLEDSERKFYSNKMVPENRHRTVPGAPYHLNKRSKLLITAAFKRGVRLKMVSSALTKNKANTSFYTISTDTIGWHIEWHFVATNTVIKAEKVHETTSLLDAAKKHTNFVQYPHLRKCLEDYKKDRLDRSRFLLKVDGLPANRARYFELSPTASIAESLKGHCLTEYPSIMVLPPGGSDTDYVLLSKDDLPAMDKENSRHLAKYHPDLNVQAVIEETLLNPNSSVYSATQDVIIIS